MSMRAKSNQIDRFGRIKFNKNKELSQASLDVGDDSEAGDDKVEESKVAIAPKGEAEMRQAHSLSPMAKRPPAYEVNSLQLKNIREKVS